MLVTKAKKKREKNLLKDSLMNIRIYNGQFIRNKFTRKQVSSKHQGRPLCTPPVPSVVELLKLVTGTWRYLCETLWFMVSQTR